MKMDMCDQILEKKRIGSYFAWDHLVTYRDTNENSSVE